MKILSLYLCLYSLFILIEEESTAESNFFKIIPRFMDYIIAPSCLLISESNSSLSQALEGPSIALIARQALY